MTKSNFKPAYFLVGFIVLVLIDMTVGSLEMTNWRHFTKPLILLSLSAYFALNGRTLQRPIYLFMLAALFFSWLGDVMLMYEHISPMYFMLGLGAFLMAHIMYMTVFLKRWNTRPGTSFWLVVVVLILYGCFLFWQLKDDLGNLLIPVVLYVLIILAMAVASFGRKGMVTPKSFTMVFLGALFFIASDSVLAINKFIDSVPYAHILVMGTYATAQYLITKGILIQEDQEGL